MLNSPTCYSAHQNGERIERFSRKVFVGGLPPDIDEGELLDWGGVVLEKPNRYGIDTAILYAFTWK